MVTQLARLHEQIVLDFINHLKANESFCAVMLYGSRAGNDFHVNSDYDLLFLTQKSFSKSYACRFQNKDFDLSFVPVGQKIKDKDIIKFRDALIIFDFDSTAENFVNRAKEIYNKGFPKTSEIAKKNLAGMLLKILNASQSQHASAYIKQCKFKILIGQKFLELRGYWSEAPKRDLELIQQIDPSFYGKYNKLLKASQFDHKLAQELLEVTFNLKKLTLIKPKKNRILSFF